MTGSADTHRLQHELAILDQEVNLLRSMIEDAVSSPAAVDAVADLLLTAARRVKAAAGIVAREGEVVPS